MEMTDEDRKDIDKLAIEAMNHEAVVNLELLKQTLTWHKLETKCIFKNHEIQVSCWARWMPIENLISITKLGAYLQGDKECSESLY